MYHPYHVFLDRLGNLYVSNGIIYEGSWYSTRIVKLSPSFTFISSLDLPLPYLLQTLLRSTVPLWLLLLLVWVISMLWVVML